MGGNDKAWEARVAGRKTLILPPLLVKHLRLNNPSGRFVLTLNPLTHNKTLLLYTPAEWEEAARRLGDAQKQKPFDRQRAAALRMLLGHAENIQLFGDRLPLGELGVVCDRGGGAARLVRDGDKYRVEAA